MEQSDNVVSENKEHSRDGGDDDQCDDKHLEHSPDETRASGRVGLVSDEVSGGGES